MGKHLDPGHAVRSERSLFKRKCSFTEPSLSCGHAPICWLPPRVCTKSQKLPARKMVTHSFVSPAPSPQEGAHTLNKHEYLYLDPSQRWAGVGTHEAREGRSAFLTLQGVEAQYPLSEGKCGCCWMGAILRAAVGFEGRQGNLRPPSQAPVSEPPLRCLTFTCLIFLRTPLHLWA